MEGIQQAIIKTKNVRKSFNVKSQSIEVLKDISIDVAKGDFAIIFGPSGCGKSTLLHTLLGLEMPTEGNVFLYGQELYDLNFDERTQLRKNKIGTIYQQSNWIKSLTVIENVAFPLSLMGVEKSDSLTRAREVLDMVGMTKWSGYIPSELSAGQQQKVSLARALITDPDLIIADEPTGNLDYKSSQELMDFFRELANKGKTVILVTHDMAFLDRADYILRMFDGMLIEKIVTKGKTQQQLQEFLVKIPTEVLQSIQTKSSTPFVEQKEPIEKLTPKIILVGLRNRIIDIFTVNLLLLLYLFNEFFALGFVKIYSRLGFLRKLGAERLVEIWQGFYAKVAYGRGSKNSSQNIKKIDLIDLSIRNMRSREIRTLVTIGGISLGIGFIVFLVSIGYGMQNIVVSRIAGLKEKRQIEVIPSVSNSIVIDDKSLEELQDVTSVKEIYPMINVAGKVNYKNSNIDVVTYGVQRQYLDNSDVSLVAGKLFQSNELFNPIEEEETKDVETEGEDAGEVPTAEIEDTAEEVVTNTESTSDDSEEDRITVELPDTGQRGAVVNESLLTLLNIRRQDALNKEFDISFIASANLIEESVKIESTPVTYKIIGVVREGDTPYVYVPIVDLKELGLTRYSQAKVIAESEEVIPQVRQQIEVLGFKTLSVLDTLTQIESIFNIFRLVLALFGAIALSVAVLGMFNTLTVSLLERTREIGLMKIIGMRSHEVFDMFLTEALTMGIVGGVGGVLLGFLMGKLLSLILSTVAITRGAAILDVSFVPLGLVIGVVFLSGFVGVVTGIFPARRATKISPLDALRYE